ncbi:SusC/RagA family TonB-linked outer membrane protein [Pedobacter psychroterrae]|uniref:SusC/RagA family TonB-linked outer membrane protein n=1 Tax=Pedobacter psychroterrae TaxID=2530453 RepID=A0A4R0NQ33_9SPHI|nr:SusC/RagA family TonB-linked outer membrane protein [Pedobacter psychroterrae]TCD02916.1 SusC/RagA family TonB-linked outer membrane protein [Pedobacter psychroterrae]
MYKNYTKKIGMAEPLYRKIMLIMRLTTVILIASLLQVSATGFAQKISLRQNDVTLESVLKEIRKQSGYDYYYGNKVISKTQKVTVTLANASVDEALERILSGLPLTYEIEGKMILIKRKEESFFDRIISKFQAVDVKGKVVDSLGNGLAGANVALKGAKGSATNTDNNGDFLLKNVAPDATLVVSYLGYVTKEVKAKDEFNYIQLQQSTSKLDEIQIQAYGKTSKRLSVGTSTTVKSDDIERQLINNPILALRAKVPNLVITQANGLPGSEITMQLRGQNSMGAWSARSEPLIVLDGVPFENTMSTKDGNYGAVGDRMSALSLIDPNTIEQIDVLADADATAIYGSRGGNGVVMITTKKGKAGPAQVSVNLASGYSQVPGKSKLKLMNTQQYLELRNEALANDGLTPQIADPDGDGYAPDLLLWDQNRYTDWQKELIGGNPRWQQASLSVTGGTNLMRYLISGNYKSDGVPYPSSFQGAKASENKLASGHINLSGNSADGKFTAGVDLTYSYNDRSGTQTDLTKPAMLLPPNAPSIYSENGELNWEPNLQANRATWRNPYSAMLNITDAAANTIIANVNTGYRITPELQIKISSAFTTMVQNQFAATPLAGLDPFSNKDDYYGKSQRINNTNNSFTLDPNITYQKQLAGGELNAIAGITYQGQTSKSETLQAGGYTDDALLKDLTKASAPFGGSPYSAYNRTSEYKYLRVFSRLNYVLADKYIANFSFSRDGSSRFGPKNKYGNYWSTGLGWIYSNEAIVKEKLPFLSYGKVRMSYGTTGQDGIGNYQYLEQYSSSPQNTYDGTFVLDGQGVINPYFKWENVKKLDIGFDFGFFSDAIVASATYWRTRTSDQLIPITTASTTGAGQYYLNLDGGTQNYGWEFSVNSENINNKTFRWSSSANLGLQNDKLLKLSPYTVLNYLYSSYYIHKGIDPIGKTYTKLIGVPAYIGIDPETGLFQFLNAEGQPGNSQEMDAYGAPVKINPLTLGLTNTFSVGNFTLITDLQFKKQRGRGYIVDFFPPGRLDMPAAYGNMPEIFTDRWRKPGDDAKFQKVSTNIYDVTDGWNGFELSDANYVDASYIRLSNAVFSYSLPKKLIDKLKVRSASINITGQNLFTITPYKFGDPETLNYYALPMLRSFTAGFNLNF